MLYLFIIRMLSFSKNAGNLSFKDSISYGSQIFRAAQYIQSSVQVEKASFLLFLPYMNDCSELVECRGYLFKSIKNSKLDIHFISSAFNFCLQKKKTTVYSSRKAVFLRFTSLYICQTFRLQTLIGKINKIEKS